MSEPSPNKAGLSSFTIVIFATVVGAAILLNVVQMLRGQQAASPAETSISQDKAEERSAPSVAENDIATLLDQISKHVLVNRNEQPTVATIQDVSSLLLRDPLFYRDAQNGDRLIVWSDKAVLYSPSRDVVLSILPIKLPTRDVATASSTPGTEVATIEVRNGTRTAGVGKRMADRLQAAGLTVLPPTDAKIKGYPTTVIMRKTTAELPQTLQLLQRVTGAAIVPLSADEGAVKGDFLVIVGENDGV